MITEEQLSETEILLKFDKNVKPEEIEQISSKIIPSTYKTVFIDLSGVYHLNFDSLGKLYMFKLELTTRLRRLVFQGCSENLFNMLRLLNFNKTVEILKITPHHHTVNRRSKRDSNL